MHVVWRCSEMHLMHLMHLIHLIHLRCKGERSGRGAKVQRYGEDSTQNRPTTSPLHLRCIGEVVGRFCVPRRGPQVIHIISPKEDAKMHMVWKSP